MLKFGTECFKLKHLIKQTLFIHVHANFTTGIIKFALLVVVNTFELWYINQALSLVTCTKNYIRLLYNDLVLNIFIYICRLFVRSFTTIALRVSLV